MPAIEIIPFEERYLQEMGELYIEVAGHVFSSDEGDEADLDDVEEATEGEVIYLARSEDRIVGFIAYYQPDHFLHSLYIHFDYQGKGVGRQLVDHIVKEHGPGHTLKVEKQNEGAIGFYSRLGYVDATASEHRHENWLLLKAP